MNIIFFGTDRPGSCRALREILDRGFHVVQCVGAEEPENQLFQLCEENAVPYCVSDQIYQHLEEGGVPDADIGISYLHPKILKGPLVHFPEYGIINFHPAPTEEHRGIGACCYCLLYGYKEWAVTAHFITPGIDEGDIVMEQKFSVEGLATAIEVEHAVQRESLKLLRDVLDLLSSGDEIPRRQQNLMKGRYWGRKDLELVKEIKSSDRAEDIDRKIKALWFPPYHGAHIVIDGQKYSLVNDDLLQELAELYRRSEK